ncbi:MAG: hypothetical protein LBT05_05200 [Planctomycetaceae bacterium]|nr:hypothetical protein [Planctomycetaceae bacterium]
MRSAKFGDLVQVPALREAIELVNTGQSEITFDASLFTDGTASIQLADELPTITTALTIDVTFENNAGKWGGGLYLILFSLMKQRLSSWRRC